MEREETTPAPEEQSPEAQVEAQPDAQPEPARERRREQREHGYRGTGVWFSVVVALLVAAAFLVFVAQNTDGVNVQWTVWDVNVSLAAVVFGAMLLGSALTLALGAIWRIRHRRRLRERDELKRLRAGSG